MALQKGRFSDIPSDAVILTEKEALKYEYQVLRKWKKKSDTWAFNYGGTVLASLSAISGIYINSYFRSKYKLGNYAKLSSYLPICVLPAAMSCLLHNELVLPGVILQNDCAVCLEMRAAALQAGTGSMFPTILAPLAISSFALRYNTYHVPYLTQEPLKVLKLWQKQMKPIGNILFAIFVAQALAGSLITYFEAKNIETVNDKLTILGYDMERQDELN